MRHPLVQVDIERALDIANERLEEITEAVKEHGIASAEADSNYSDAYYEIYVQTPGAMELRKAIARDATKDLFRAKRHAEAVLDSTKEAGRNCREECENLRSLNANVRPQVTHRGAA